MGYLCSVIQIAVVSSKTGGVDIFLHMCIGLLILLCDVSVCVCRGIWWM